VALVLYVHPRYAQISTNCRFTVWINLPISGLAGLLILLFLDIQHEHTSFIDGIKAVDWAGMFSFLGFTLMVLLGLDFGEVLFPWNSAKVIALLVVGGCMIWKVPATNTVKIPC
jgi:hypothetical protein